MPETKLLNEEQQKAAQHGDGPLLIIAGAGTGKTTVITERIKHLILKKKNSPSEILALTFTEKAAKEMEERVDVVMPYGYTQMWISTFHAFCDRVLRDEAIHIGLNPTYRLFSEAEILLFLRQNIFKFNFSYFRPLGNPYKFLNALMQHFSRLKDEDIQIEQYLRFAKRLTQGPKTYDEDEVKKIRELASAYRVYETLKVKEGVMDFGDLVSNTLALFRKRRNILNSYRNHFKYILVDEFQDTNYAQNTLAMLLAGDKKNITVVGDDDQAIYRWRGAAISNIIQFKKSYPDAKIITLTKNYRSTSEILNKSYVLIQNNNPDRLEIKEKIDKKLTAQRKGNDAQVELLFADRVEDEAELVVKKIHQKIEQKKYDYKDFAILVRANDYAGPFIRSLSRHNIPYQFLGPGRLFHQEEIKDLIAYLKILYNFEDSASLYRILNLPIFKLESRDIAALLNFARKRNLTLFEALEKVSDPNSDEKNQLQFNAPFQGQLKTIYDMIKKHLARVSKDTAGQILYYFLDDSGLLRAFLSMPSQVEDKRYQNIARFFDKLKSYEAEHEDASVFAIVDWIELSTQMGESPLATDMDWNENNAVNILTIHSSKGLEFAIVFLVNLVSQRFPSRERKEIIPLSKELIKEILPEGDFHLQEERRLFYVGMTRAKNELYLTAANFYGEGKRERKLSPFVFETLGLEGVEASINKKVKKIIQPSLLDWIDQLPYGKQTELLQRKIPDAKITILAKPTNHLPITYLSYSQIQCFEICPLHYKLKYLLKIPVAPTASQSFGTSVHAALKDFYSKWQQEGSISKSAINQILKKNWIREGYMSKDHQKSSFEKAKEILKNHLDKNFNPQLLNKKSIKLELPFQFFINHPKDKTRVIKVGGRIDRIDKLNDDQIEILDYKTGNTIPDEKTLDKDLQLTIYALAATCVQDEFLRKKPEDVILSLYYLVEDKKLTTTRTKEQLEEAKDLLFQKADQIGQSEFLCVGSSLCLSCEYKILCNTNN